MKTKIISIVVMLMMACNVMAQDYLTVFFKDGKTERHLLSLVQNISVTKYDKDSISHSDYQCQQIVLKNAIYTYPISEIDSITFNKVDESQIIENVTSTLTEIHQLLEKDAFSYNFTEYADIIRNNPGVSDAQVIEDKLVVKIKDWRNIVYMHPTDFQEVNDESLNNKYRISPVSARKHKSENVNSAINVAIVNQFSHAEERKVIVEKCEFLKSQFEELGFNADYITELDLAFFNDKIFDYDIIMLNTHGGYLLDKHWLLTSEEMGETSSSIIAHIEGFINDFKNHLDEDIDDVTYYCIDEERDGEKKWIYYVAVSEDYIKQRPKKFNSGTLIYANVCESLKDNDNLANIFINKGASSYLGYDKKSVYGWTAGPYFYDLALNGLSIQKAYSSIPKNYNPEDSKYKASLRLLPNGDSSPHFITKTITAPADEVSEEIQNDGSHLFTFYGYTSLYYYTIDYITMGFQFSTDSEMKNAQDAPVVNSFTYVDNEYGNYKFYRTLSIEPGTTVHYRAYTYDGLYYNYGEIRSFTLEKADPLTLSQNSISLTAGNSTTVEITSGNGGYTVSVDKPTIATATLYGTTITIKGESKGTAKVTVKDKSGQTAEISVNVWDNLTLSQSSVGLYPGNSTTVEITNGSGHYSVSVDKPAVATASLSGSVITIKGVGVGSAVVTVTDTSTNQTAKINVTVSSAPTLVVSNSSVELMVGGSSTVEITSGSGSYEITNSNVNVVQAVLDGAKITLTAKAEGNAVVTVKDKATGQTASISVTVNSNTNLVLSQSNVDLTVGAQTTVEIVSGDGDYSVSVDKPSIATATLSGTKITITGVAAGTAKVTVKDNSGQTAYVNVTVISANELVLSNSVVNITVGSEATVEIISGSGDYSLAIDDSSIATYSLSGSIITVKGIRTGTAVVTVTDNVTKQKKAFFVNVSTIAEAIDLGLPSGTKWASWNVGASAPEEYGGYYAWGETEEKDYYDENTYKYYDSETNEYIHIGDDIAGTEYDVAHVKWGGSWRMPSLDQIRELIDNCTREGTQQNGVNGIRVTGPNGNSIFLPAAGDRFVDHLSNEGSFGYFWSSSLYPGYEYFAYRLCFLSHAWGWIEYYRISGQSVRPVCPKANK